MPTGPHLNERGGLLAYYGEQYTGGMATKTKTGERREATIMLRVTTEEKKTLADAAARVGLDLSSWLRSVGLKAAAALALVLMVGCTSSGRWDSLPKSAKDAYWRCDRVKAVCGSRLNQDFFGRIECTKSEQASYAEERSPQAGRRWLLGKGCPDSVVNPDKYARDVAGDEADAPPPPKRRQAVRAKPVNDEEEDAPAPVRASKRQPAPADSEDPQ